MVGEVGLEGFVDMHPQENKLAVARNQTAAIEDRRIPTMTHSLPMSN